jgi:hypothetical protein
MNEGIVGTRQNLIIVELEASNDVCRMRWEGEMMRSDFATHPTLLKHVVTTIQRLV